MTIARHLCITVPYAWAAKRSRIVGAFDGNTARAFQKAGDAIDRIVARPADLAISVYHRPQDLQSIPLALAARLDRYRFALRCHAHNGFDAVLYARALQ